MCGRFFLGNSPELGGLWTMLEEAHPGINEELKQGEIRPTDKVAVFRGEGSRLKLDVMGWGYRVEFRKGPLINAKSETVVEKVFFADDFRNRRCLIPASGFYEWNGEKKKYFFENEKGLLYLAGIYRREEGSYRYVILTRPALEPVIEVHHRMPVMISRKNARAWLEDFDAAKELLKGDPINLTSTLDE